jgi:hypothetical protein
MNFATLTKMLRHPERSRSSGGAKDLPCNGIVGRTREIKQ